MTPIEVALVAHLKQRDAPQVEQQNIPDSSKRLRMSAAPHEILVMALAERPDLLAVLLARPSAASARSVPPRPSPPSLR
jgi:hypothetical protein